MNVLDNTEKINKMKEYFDKNPESIPYLNRLVKEWKEHGKIVISVDYDSTIFPYHTIDNAEHINKVISVLKIAKETGAYIAIFTCSNPDRHDEIMDYCKTKGLIIDSINVNPIDLPYGHHGKIYANIYIDDRAGLVESLNILEFAMYKIRGSKNIEMYDF